MRQKMREIFAMARCSDWADTPCIRLMHEQIAMVWCQSVMSLWDSKPIRRKLKMKQNAMHGGINVFLYSCWQIFHSLHSRRNVGSWWWDPLLWKLVAGDILRNTHIQVLCQDNIGGMNVHKRKNVTNLVHLKRKVLWMFCFAQGYRAISVRIYMLPQRDSIPLERERAVHNGQEERWSGHAIMLSSHHITGSHTIKPCTVWCPMWQCARIISIAKH